jgi:hypothetical protein
VKYNKDIVYDLYYYFLKYKVIIGKDNYISFISAYDGTKQTRNLYIQDDTECFITKHNNSELAKDEI